MKIFGVFWGSFSIGILALTVSLSDMLAKYDDVWVSPVYGYIVGIVAFVIFFNLLIIRKGKIIFVGPLFFIFRKNIIHIIEVSKIEFTKVNHVTTSSVEIEIFDNVGLVCFKTTIYWFKFELERLKKELSIMDIKISSN